MPAHMTLGQNTLQKQYHIAVTPDDGFEYAILPGDPGRVLEIANHLENPRFVAANREYTTYGGELAGKKVCVTSTGIGGPSAAIAMEELVRCGVHTFIRIGTCGGMQDGVLPGDIIIASAAVRAEGTSGEYIPAGYPASADFYVTNALREAAIFNNLPHHVGVVHSKDSFYGQTEPDTMPLAESLKNKWDAYIASGCLASEMEAAALFAVGLVRSVRVGAVLTAIWNPELRKKGAEQTEYKDNERAILCAVGAIRRLASGIL